MHAIESEVERIMSEPWSYRGLPPRAQNDLRLSFSSNYSLGVWSCWSVFSDGASFFIRRIEWARGRDRVRVAGEAPTTYGAESPLPSMLAAELLAQANAFATAGLPLEPSGITIDGVSRWLFVRDAANQTISVNWQAGAACAEAIDSWLEAASEASNEVLPSSSAREAQSAA